MQHKMFDNKKVIIFDMDGTLIDSIGMWNDVDGQLIDIINADGIPVDYDNIQSRRDEYLRANKHLPQPYVSYCEYLKGIYHCDMTPQEMHSVRYGIAQKYLTSKICYKPGADTLIRQLHSEGYTLAIATNTQRRVMDIYCTTNTNFTEVADINSYFSIVLTIEDVPASKPDPIVHYTIMQQLAVTPEQCLIFEDSIIGIEAACNAGIESVAIYDKYSDCDRDAINNHSTYQIDSYTDIL